MNVAGLFPAPRSDASKRLAKLGARRDELQAERRAMHSQSAVAEVEETALRAELREAQARDRAFADAAPTVQAVAAKLAKMEDAAAQRAEESRILGDAIGHVETEVVAHAREHAAELEGELREDAGAAAQSLTDALAAFAAAHDEYLKVGSRGEALLRLVDADRARTNRVPGPDEGVARFAKAARGVAVPVPMPTPPGVVVASS